MIFIFFIGKSHKHPVGVKPTNLPSTKHLQGEEVPVELQLIGNIIYFIINWDTLIPKTNPFPLYM